MLKNVPELEAYNAYQNNAYEKSSIFANFIGFFRRSCSFGTELFNNLTISQHVDVCIVFIVVELLTEQRVCFQIIMPHHYAASAQPFGSVAVAAPANPAVPDVSKSWGGTSSRVTQQTRHSH